MKLLICTQAIDKNDPILGFFHRWVEEFAKHFKEVHVICLKEGDHSLPSNVTVYSLGKEDGESVFKYVAKFYRYLFLLRGSYDRVFVHMNPHYILLAGLYWKFFRIPIFFWRNHARMNMMTRIAVPFAKHVFYTSTFACTSRYAHARQMPVGIDTDTFKPSIFTAEHGETLLKKILFLGRVSPVKRAELFIEAATHAPQGYEFHVYGDDPTKDQKYLNTLKEIAGTNVLFHPSIKNDETPNIYRSHDVFVNLTPEGSMDKAVIEAASCGVSVLVSNISFSNTLPPLSIATDVEPKHLAQNIVVLAELSSEEKQKNIENTREYIVKNHSLEKLATMLYNYMK